mgnify:FL=1
MFINYPVVKINSKMKVFLSFYINNKRVRLYNGKRIKSTTNPNSFPIKDRFKVGNLLAAEVYKYITQGGILKEYRSKTIVSGELTDFEYLKEALENKINGGYSAKYVTTLRYIYNEILKKNKSKNINPKTLKEIIGHYPTNTSKNTIRRHINALINEAKHLGMETNPMRGIKSFKSKAVLHKPFGNVKAVLEDIKSYNKNLYLCCLLTYGCLLRPHREVRELTWGDFTGDLKFIKLSGERNKSGKNRVVPVPVFVREVLNKHNHSINIFSETEEPYNPDYFKTLWGKYKKQSNALEAGQTLYSFRHSGAIEIFNRTGSLVKLQQTLGHSSINVSLTYLRGLEVTELIEEDMPRID